MRPSLAALLRPGHVLPTASAEEPVVAAGDELSAVLEGYAVSLFAALPVRQYAGERVAAIVA